MATICCARTSSGLRGSASVSMAPSCIRCVTTAALEQVAAVLREDHALRRRADLVTGPADPLQARARPTVGTLDLDRRGRPRPCRCRARGCDVATSAGTRPALSSSSIWSALLAGDAAVMRPDELLAGELVEPLGEALREAAAVDEDDRASGAPDELQDPRMDRRPDADARVRAGRRAARLLLERQGLAEAAHVLDRHDDLRARAACARRRRRSRRRGPARCRPRKRGDRLERPLRRRQPDPLRRRRAAPTEPLEPLQAQGEVRAALRARDRVDLVDDDVLDAAERSRAPARQQEVQRLGGGDRGCRAGAGRAARRSSAGVSPVRERDARSRGAGSPEALRRRGRCRRGARAGCARRRRSAP